MVNIVTSKGKLPQGVTLVESVDAYFNRIILSKVGIDNMPKHYLMQFDEATVLKGGNVQTKFGVCSPRMLSTGLKTLCIVIYCKNTPDAPKAVLLTECGANVLEAVFAELDGSNVIGVLQHTYVDNCSDRMYSVNGRCVDNLQSLQALLELEVKPYGV